MSGFHPGQRVLCINGKFDAGVCEWTSETPREGVVYTVADVRRCPHRITGIVGTGLRLVEIPHGLPGSTTGLHYCITRFVPVELIEDAFNEQEEFEKLWETLTPEERDLLEKAGCEISAFADLMRPL